MILNSGGNLVSNVLKISENMSIIKIDSLYFLSCRKPNFSDIATTPFLPLFYHPLSVFLYSICRPCVVRYAFLIYTPLRNQGKFWFLEIVPHTKRSSGFPLDKQSLMLYKYCTLQVPPTQPSIPH